MKHPDPDDDLSELFTHLRAAPSAADPARAAPGFETRVLARVHATAAPDALRWFWRWSAVFGTAAIVCAVLVVQDYRALNDDALVTLEDGVTLVDLFY